MAVLKFKIHADYERVMRLREEIAKLEKQMKSFGRNTPVSEMKAVEKRMAEAKAEMSGLVSEAAKAGAIMEKGFKTKIYDASVAVNSLTEKIIDQRSAVRGAENEVKRLGEAYRKALKVDAGNAPMLKTDYDKAKDALNKEKNALFELTQEKAKASLETKKLRDEYSAFKQEAGEAVKANEGLTLSLGKIAGLVGGVTALKQLASEVVRVRGEFQEMETAISTLVGQDMADKLLPQIKEMAKVSPLTLTDIVGAEKMMLGFNIEADKTIDYLKALSDVSMGSSQKFNSLTLAFSQMSAAGRLMGQDLNQMINAGFNPLQVIAEKTGKSIAQLKDEMSKGAVSAEMVQQAFIDATSAGGKFYNMSENASKTINGQLSMMRDAMDAAFNEMGTKSEGIILKSIQATTSLIQNYEKIGKVLVGLVATYGVYRTAVLLSTAATSKHTIAEIALINVRIAARKAQIALNSAMLTNPYVALATAVAGLVAGYIALKDNTTAAEKAQRDYGKMKENASQKEKEHADAIQSLIDKVRDETQAEVDRTAALIALKNEYPAIFADYDAEKLKLDDILKLKKLINEEDAARRKAGDRELLDEYDRSIAKAEEDIKNAPNMGAGSLAYLVEAQKRLERLKALRESLLKDMKDTSVAEFTGSLADKSLEELQEYLKRLEAGTFELDGSIADTSTANTLKDAVKEAIENINNASKTSYSVDYEEAKRAWEKAKAKFEEVRKDKERFTTEEYNERKNALEKAEKDFKALGGDTTGKGAKTEADAVKAYNEQVAQQEKVRQAEDRAKKERAREAKNNEFMIAQARIDAMREGADKTRAQQDLDNRRELENLERQKQDYIEKAVERERAIFEAREDQRAQNEKNYKRQAFDAEAVRSKVDTSAYDEAIRLTQQKQKGQQDELLNDLLNRYKSYEDAKQEILISYLNESDELQAMYEETGDARYKRSLDERYKAYVQALNRLEKEFGSDEYRLIFGDPAGMTSETIGKALEAARGRLSQLDKEADPESYKALIEAIDKLEDARANNPFQGWDTSVMGLIQKLHQIKNIRKDIAEYEKQGNTEAVDSAKGQLEKARGDLSKALLGTGVSQFGETLSTAAASMKEIAKASGDIDLERQAEALEKAGGFISSVASGAASGGWVGAIVGGATSLMDMLISSITESKVVAAEAKKAYEDYIADIIRSRRQINDEDYETIFGVRALEKVVDASKAAQKAWEDYTEAMEVEVGNAQSGRGYAKGLENLALPSGEKLKDQFKEIFEWEKNGRGQGEVSGLNLKEARKLLEAYEGTEQATSNWYKQLQKAVDALEDYEENMKVVDEYLGQLFNNVGDELVDAIMRGEDAMEVLKKSSGDIFASIAKQMISELLISQDFIDEYKERMRKAISTEDMTDDADVLNEMAETLSEKYKQAQEVWDNVRRIAEENNIDMNLGGESQQQASGRGYQTLSEETGSELSGRALAQYEATLRMETALAEIRNKVVSSDEEAPTEQYTIRNIAEETRTIIADSYLELQQIRENTGAVIKPIKDISADVKEMRRKLNNL